MPAVGIWPNRLMSSSLPHPRIKTTALPDPTSTQAQVVQLLQNNPELAGAILHMAQLFRGNVKIELD